MHFIFSEFCPNWNGSEHIGKFVCIVTLPPSSLYKIVTGKATKGWKNHTLMLKQSLTTFHFLLETPNHKISCRCYSDSIGWSYIKFYCPSPKGLLNLTAPTFDKAWFKYFMMVLKSFLSFLKRFYLKSICNINVFMAWHLTLKLFRY